MVGFRFDKTINLGHVLTIVTLVGLGISNYYSLRMDQANLRASIDHEVALRERGEREQNALLARIEAIQNQNMGRFERVFDELKSEIRAMNQRVNSMQFTPRPPVGGPN